MKQKRTRTGVIVEIAGNGEERKRAYQKKKNNQRKGLEKIEKDNRNSQQEFSGFDLEQRSKRRSDQRDRDEGIERKR